MGVTLNLIAVPNGFTGDGSLAVSIVVAPRLTNGRRLGEFADMLEWTEALAEARPELVLRLGTSVVRAEVDLSGLRPDLWRALFDERTPVTPFTFDDATNSVVVSYRTRDAVTAVKQTYQTVIAASPSALPTAVDSARRLTPLALPDGPELDELLARHRMNLWRRRGEQTKLNASGRPADDLAKDFALFYRMPQPGPRAPDPIPRTAAALRDILDFHGAVTSLSAHPSLMRALGLILDAKVDAAAVKAAGALGMALATVAVEKFRTARPFEDVVALAPPVLYRHHPAAAGLVPVFATADSDPAAIVEGFLGLDAEGFHLLDLDVDGALAKLTSLATMLPRASKSPTSDGALPALRSAGLSLAVHNRGTEIIEGLRRAAQLNTAINSPGAGATTPLTASDIVRGYRLDVWSSATGRWRSLHRRQATYSFEAPGTAPLEIEEEGFAQFASASPAPDPTRPAPAIGPPVETDLYVHEALARWTGWSLSAPRPGKALHRTDAHDPLKDDDSVDALVTAFKMRQRFLPVPGSLPALRFGRRYRMRVRVVDIAGNSPPWNELESAPVVAPTHPVALPSAPEAQAYFRYEPVLHPRLVLRTTPQDDLPSVDRIVIRSFNTTPALDRVATTDTGERHIAPPRVAVELAERHGMFDDISGTVKGDAATFATIVARNDAAFAVESMGTPPIDVPIERAARVPVDYLPDPLARAAALRFLPGMTAGRVVFAGAGGLVNRQTDGSREAGPVVQVHFGDAWPNREGFRLVIVEGSAPPEWDETTRVLTAFVPKATDTEVRLSSAMSDADLELMGVWAWEREHLERVALEVIASGDANLARRLEQHARLSERLVRLALEGGQWALTPSIPVHVIHAVQQPIGRPVFVNGAAAAALNPVRGASLRVGRRTTDRRAALIAVRAPGSPDATLLGGLDVHLRSSGRVDLTAAWNDITDDKGAPEGYVLTPAKAAIEPIRIDRMSGSLPAQGTAPRNVAVIAGEDQLTFAPETFVGASLVPAAAPIQHFGDTRHRLVTYRAVSTSRFERDFPPGLDFTRTSDEVVVSVPSSAAPPAPVIVQVLPTFGWQRERTGTVTSTIREGRGVRIYLDRPWFASGVGELLGVVLWRRDVAPPTAAARRDQFAGLVTEWGLDPLRRSGRLSAMPGLADLTAAATVMENVRVPEAGIVADIAGHVVHSDGDLWYADVTLAAEDAYMPFLRLALVRFQPDSITGAEISTVASAGFTQLTPDRSAVLVADPSLPRIYRLVVSGVAPTPSPMAPWKNVIQVDVEERRGDVPSDLGWQPVAAGVAKVTPVTTNTNAPAVLFSGLVEFAAPLVSGRYRLVIREFETWQVDPEALFHGLVAKNDAVSSADKVVPSVVPRITANVLASPTRDAFVLTNRAIDRLAPVFVGPPTGRRLVYAEFLHVEPPAAVRDLSIGGAPAPGEAGEDVDVPVTDEAPLEPGADLVGPDLDDGVPPWPPIAAPPPAGFQPEWDAQPVVTSSVAPNAVSGAVKLAQAMLNVAVSPVPPLAIDGLFGPLVDVAMRALRVAAGLPNVGGIDLQGWLALAGAAPFPTLEPGLGNPPMTGPPVAFVQRLLNTISDSNFLPEDGVFTSDTADRVNDFQSISDLPETGVVDLGTWRALVRLVDHFNPSGSERVTLGFDRTRSDAGGPALVLLDRDVLADATMPVSDRLDESWSGRAGLWVEMQDSQERPVFRRSLGHLLSLPIEVVPASGAGGRIGRPGPTHDVTTISFVVPVLGAARRLVVVGTIDPDDRGPASPIAVFDPW